MSEYWNLHKLKRGELNFWEESILQKVWIIWSPLLYFKFKSFLKPNFPSFVSFQCILYDSLVFFSEPWNFHKLNKGDLISVVNQFWRMSELFGPPFCSSVLKVLLNKLLRHSLYINAFCMIQEYFSQSLEISTN